MFSPELKKGSMELLVLSLLTETPRHGYEIGQLIELRSGGKLEFKVSTLYPVLARMENRGWIKGKWVEKPGERRRCYYSLQPAGKKALTEKREHWQAFIAAVGLVVGESHG